MAKYSAYRGLIWRYNLAYICKKKNREGHFYVYLVEGYRLGNKVKQRIIKKYGALDAMCKTDELAYDKLKAQVKAQQQLKVPNLRLQMPIAVLDQSMPHVSLQNYGYGLLIACYEQLGIAKQMQQLADNTRCQFDLDAILKHFIVYAILDYARGLDFESSIDQRFAANDSLMMNQTELRRGLTQLPRFAEELQYSIHRALRKTAIKTATFCLVDVSNYYSDAAKQVSVQMAMILDAKQLPVCFRLLKGKKASMATYAEIENARAKYGIGRLITIFDWAEQIDLRQIITYTLSVGDGYIVLSKINHNLTPPDIQNFAASPQNWKLSSNGKFAKKSQLRQRQLNNGNSVTEKVVILWSLERAEFDFANRTHDEQLLGRLSEHQVNRPVSLHYTNSACGYKLPGKFQQFDGIRVIVTSEIKLTENKIVALYGQRWQTEENYVRSQTTLAIDNMYKLTHSHPKGIFLVGFLSWLMLSYLQLRLDNKYSQPEIVNALLSGIATEMSQDLWLVFGNEVLADIHRRLGINWPNSVKSVQELKHYVQGHLPKLEKMHN